MADPYTGQIAMVPFTYAPYDWAFCDGAEILVQQNPALFAILGNMYGGDGRTKFALPNLQGKAVAGPAPNYGLAQPGVVVGAYTKSVGAANLPAHTHAAMAAAVPGTTATAMPVANLSAQGFVMSGPAPARSRSLYAPYDGDVVPMNPNMIVAAGTGTTPVSVNNRQPYLPINMIICLDGTFPPKPD